MRQKVLAGESETQNVVRLLFCAGVVAHQRRIVASELFALDVSATEGAEVSSKACI